MQIRRLAPNPERAAAIIEFDAARTAHRTAPLALEPWRRLIAARQALRAFGISA